ncbi:hypothetical protein KN1_20350 [Stygiolobus caldivivus]|uniref:Uncharacterized protein n=1 Tax=Stygiolobus caldivivus TaxID=2824673 RepID=A0A8D5ZG87_9CREN|nr:hypothetical protein KN1_20350 [Stygiolobus caldivivus]
MPQVEIPFVKVNDTYLPLLKAKMGDAPSSIESI